MAFKMRSGNKPGFKNMGSSPAKQEDDGLNTGVADAIKERNAERLKSSDLQEQLDALKKANSTSEDQRSRRKQTGKMTTEDRALQAADREQNARDQENMPWSQKVKDQYGDKDKRDGYVKNADGTYEYRDTDEDTTIRERRANNRANREKSKKAMDDYLLENPKPTDKTKVKEWRKNKNAKKKELKYSDKTKKLHAKYQDAQASGAQGLKFNLGGLLTGGITGAFDTAPKRDILSKKIIKRKAKKVNKEKVADIKRKTKEERKRRRNK